MNFSRLILPFIFCGVIISSKTSLGQGKNLWPQFDKLGFYEGDIKIGGIFMVHDRNNELICGDIFPEAGIQPLEMMIFALDLINQNFSHLLPGIKLGGIFVDDCDRDTVGVERSLEFVQGIFQAGIGNDRDRSSKPIQFLFKKETLGTL